MMTKAFTQTLQSKSGLIFFAALAAYNLLLGVYLKDFLVLSPMLLASYLLSALPPLLFVIRIRSAPMRAIVYIVLFATLLMSALSVALCRRILPMLTLITTAAQMMYLGIFDNSSGKDKPLTKIYVLTVSVLIVVALFVSYLFVSKPETPYLLNGGNTLWDTQTEELADEICTGCETDAERVQAIYSWMVTNLEYDYDYYVIFSISMFAKHSAPSKVFALTFPICLPRSAVARIFLAMLLTEYPIRTTPFSTLGTVCTTTVLGGTWM